MRCHGYGTQILITLRGGGITEWVLFQLLLLLLLSVRSGGHAIDRWMGLPPSLLPLLYAMPMFDGRRGQIWLCSALSFSLCIVFRGGRQKGREEGGASEI